MEPLHHRILLASLLAFLTALASCIDPITIDAEREGNQLLIDGFVTDGSGPHEVRIAITREKQRTTPIEQALVELVSEDGEREQMFEEMTPGTYVHRAQQLQAQPGKAYHLEITLVNGRQYATQPDTMPELIGRDSVYYGEGSRNGQDVMYVFADSWLPDTPEPLYVRWEVEEYYRYELTDFPDPWGNIPPPCFVFGDIEPQRINLFDGARFRTRQITRQQVGIRPLDYTFLHQHWINVYQQSMSREAFRYWSQVRSVVEQTGSIFDVPPAEVRGNAFRVGRDDQVLGYFAALRQDTARYVTYRGDFAIRSNDPCLYTPFKQLWQYPDECLQCGVLENSTPVQPDYFR